MNLTKFYIDLHAMFFRLSAEVNSILSPCIFIGVFSITTFSLTNVFQLSLVSVKQQEATCSYVAFVFFIQHYSLTNCFSEILQNHFTITSSRPNSSTLFLERKFHQNRIVILPVLLYECETLTQT